MWSLVVQSAWTEDMVTKERKLLTALTILGLAMAAFLGQDVNDAGQRIHTYTTAGCAQ